MHLSKKDFLECFNETDLTMSNKIGSGAEAIVYKIKSKKDD